MYTYQIGEKEYSLEELQGLISDGESKREYETKYNTNFDSAWSAYGKSQNEKKELERQLEEERAKHSAPEVTTPTEKTDFDFDAIAKEKGLLTRDEAQQLVEQTLSTRDQVNGIVSKFKSLESEIDGKDGRPKFDQEEILSFMQERNLLDPEEAYKLKHMDELSEWKANQIGKKPGFAPSNNGNTATDKTPAPVSITRDNLDQALHEALREGGGKI